MLRHLLICATIISIPSTSHACLDEKQIRYKKRALEIDSTEVCNHIASLLVDPNSICKNDRHISNETIIDVVQMQRSDISVFDIFIIAPSQKQSNYLGKNGFESHKFRVIFMMSLNCRVSIWSYMYEPRFLRGGFRIAQNRSNPNWTHLQDFHGSRTYSDVLRQWMIDLFLNERTNSK